MTHFKLTSLMDTMNNIYRSGYVIAGSTKPKHRKLPMPPYKEYPIHFVQPHKGSIITKKFVSLLDNIGKYSLTVASKAGENHFKHLIEAQVNMSLPVSKKSKMFAHNIQKIARSLTQNQDIKMINSHNLDEIVQKNEPCIFIMNHGNYIQDCFSLAKLNEILYEKSIKAGKVTGVPRPKIIMNKDILESQSPKMRKFFDNIGAVGVNADFYHPDTKAKNHNIKQLLPLIRRFINGENHIFIFPEGGLGTYTNTYPLEHRFQIGVGNIAKIIAENQSNKVNVIPVGFHYNLDSSKPATVISVGKPVCIKKKNNQYYSTAGNITAQNTSENYKMLFHSSPNKGEYKRISNGDVNIPEHLMERYISGILAENLKIVMKEAEEVNKY